MSDGTTERNWFSYRYAIPGFVLIIFVFLLNIDRLAGLFKNSTDLDWPAVVAILTFFSGPSVGFVVTQAWYRLFDACFRYRFYGEDLIKEAQGIVRDKSSSMIDLDYWACTQLTPRLYNFLTGRWDLFHVLGSTATTVPISLAIGYGLRCLDLVSLLTGSSSPEYTPISITSRDQIVFVIMPVAAILSFALLVWSAIAIRKQSRDIMRKIIQNQTNCREAYE